MPNEKAQKLRLIMSKELCVELEKIRIIYKTKATAERGTTADILNKKGDSVRDIIVKLQDHPFKEKVIAECENLFYHFEFEKVLDNNRYLMGFNNGVYDLKLKTFRKAIPEDYVSATTGYDYEDLNMDDENVIGVDGFMRGIQPADDMNLYVWIYCASFVEGGNKDQKFIIFTGSGSNGKSVLTTLLKQALGDYYGTVPIELITKERGSASSANPEMEDKKVVRTLTMEEPERGAKIYTSYIKLITGGTPIMARGLYKNPIYFVPQFKLLISCNDKPTIEADDGGTWRRMIVINFGMKFVKNPDPNKPNERLKDKSLDEKSKLWGPAFMWLLLNKYYPMYAEHDLDYFEPDNVRVATQQYKEDSNVFLEYFNSGEIIKDEKGKISIRTVHTYFKNWHEQLYSEKKVPMLKKLMEYCKKENIPIDGQNMILGYKLKVQQTIAQSNEFDA
jgi:P4 family phage/plasmid primase-like protien